MTLRGLSVLFIDGTSGFSPHRLATKYCGGIITSLTLIPRYLAANGVRVVVASEYSVREEMDGVLYTPTIEDYERNADIVVFNRNIFNKQMESMFPKSKKVWWLHDIVDYRYLEDDSYLKMDCIVALSKYNVDSYAEFFNISRDMFTIIPNGVDKSIFYPCDEHDNHLFICASAPIKGLYPMAFTWHNILRNDPKAELIIYSSQKLHDKENSKQIEVQLKQLSDGGAKIMEPVSQYELANVLRKARGLLMPNHYPEICSNLILQAQACGTPVVTTNIGSAGEFIAHGVTGMLTRRTPSDMFWWWKDFAEQAVKAQTDDTLYKRIHTDAPKTIPSWQDIGLLWLKLIREG